MSLCLCDGIFTLQLIGSAEKGMLIEPTVQLADREPSGYTGEIVGSFTIKGVL